MEEVGYTVAENELLNRLAAGELDGVVVNHMNGLCGDSECIVIVNGIPARYRESPSLKSVKEGKIMRIQGRMLLIREWKTEDEKLFFLRLYGITMHDPDAEAYARASLKKPRKEKRRKYRISLSKPMFRIYPVETTDGLF